MDAPLVNVCWRDTNVKWNWSSSAFERRRRKVGGNPFAMASGSWISVSLLSLFRQCRWKYAYLHILDGCIVSSIFVCIIPSRGKCVWSNA